MDVMTAKKHIGGDAKHLYQPIRTNNFEFVISIPVDNTAFANWSKSDAVQVSVISFKPPHFSQEEIPVKKGNSTVYFAGVPSFQEGSLKINDFYEADGADGANDTGAKSFLRDWQNAQYSVDDDVVYNSSNYKLDGTLFELSPAGKTIRTWQIKGAWIKSLEEDEFNAESSNKKTVTATLRFDYAYEDTKTTDASGGTTA